MDIFHHERAIQPRSAFAQRWPRIQGIRSGTTAGRYRWRITAGPCRTRRAAFRQARKLRDARGIHYRWFPGATLYGVANERGKWWVMTRPARGKRSKDASTESEPIKWIDDSAWPSGTLT